jgi:hypothetical protein
MMAKAKVITPGRIRARWVGKEGKVCLDPMRAQIMLLYLEGRQGPLPQPLPRMQHR